MNTILLRLIVIVLVTIVSLVASQKKTDSIANISAVPLYNINKNTLQETIKKYINNYPNLKALKIVESLTNETYVTIFKDKNKIFYNKELPKSIEKLSFYKSISKYENEEVGTVFAYFDKSSELNLTQEEISWIKNNPSIRYTYDSNWAPFEWQNELNQHTGILSDILNIVSQKSGIKFITINVNKWSDAVEKAKLREVDMYSGISQTTEKSSYMHFTKKSIYKIPYVFVTRVSDNSDYFDIFNDLENKKVGVVDGYSIQDILKKDKPELSLLSINSTKKAFEKLQDKSIDVFIVNAASAKYYISRLGFDNLKIATTTSLNMDLKIAIRKDWPIETISIIDKSLNTITKKELSDIYHKWADIKVEKKTDWTIVFQIMGLALLIIIVVLFVSYQLKQKVKEKTSELTNLLHSFDENVIASRSDLSGKITYASKAFANITGYSVEELIGKPHSTVRHPDMPKETFEDLWKTIKSGNIWKGEVKNKNKSGGFYWVDVVIEPMYDLSGKIVGYSAIRHDITSKKEVEELSTNLEIKVEERTTELQVVQQKFESMVSNVPGAIYRVVDDSAWPIIYMSDEIEKITGYAASDFMESKIVTFSTIMYPDDVEPIGHSIVEQFAKGNKFVVEYRIITKSEDIVWVRSEGKSIIGENGESWIDGVLVDITEMVKSKNEVEESAIRFSLLANNISQLAWMADEDGNIFWYNERWYDYTGTTLEEMKGWGWKTVHHPDHIDRVIEKISNCFEKGIAWEDSFPLKSKDGEFRWFLSRATPIKDDDGNIIRWFGTNTDITENKQLLDEIEQIHKHTKESIEYASLIQGALVPNNNAFNSYFSDYLTIWQPKDIVGGDIYLFEELREKDECLLMVIDCTGHGVPGAFVTMLVKAIERQVISKIENDRSIEISPAWILSYFNKTMKKLLQQESEDSISNAGFDGGIIYYNKKENIIKFAGAETPLFYIEDNELKTIKGNRHSIGYKKSKIDYEFKEHIIEVKEGIKFYLSTDGCLDQNGGEKSFPFGKKRFSNILIENHNEVFANQKKILIDSLEKYQGDEDRNDDVTIVAFKI